ncbi:MAG: Holliday junction branch migration protein RuvA [Pseudohongiellaceae bacterium]
MIGRIRGTLLTKQATDILVDVGGLAYEVHVPLSTLYVLPDTGAELILHTHYVVREDAHQLFGFAEEKERRLFRGLIKVNGVGPKLALTILSGMEVDDFVRTISSNDINSLIRMPGVGKKTAERLIVEMRDRLAEWHVEGAGVTDGGLRAADNRSQLVRDAETALTSLGYKPAEAARAVSRVSKERADISDSESLIRLALKSMV